MNPYRSRGKPPLGPDQVRDDEQVVLWIAFFVGILPAVFAIGRGIAWGAEPTIGLLVAVLAGTGLMVKARDAIRERQAEIRRDTSEKEP